MINKITGLIVLLLLVSLVVVNLVTIKILNKNLSIQQKNLEITEDLFLGDLTYQYYNDLSTCIDSKIQTGNKDEVEKLKIQCKEEMKDTNLYQKIQKYGGEDLIKN